MKKLLIVVDYQVDFVSGSLGFEKAKTLENKILDKIIEYKNEHIIYTLDTHYSDYLQTNEGQNLPVEHCIKGTEGWEIYGTVKYKLSGYACFEKNTFGSEKLIGYLKAEKYDEIELVGVVTNICILSNAVIAKTALPDAIVKVDSDCVASFDDNLHEKALDIMQGIHIEIQNRGKNVKN